MAGTILEPPASLEPQVIQAQKIAALEKRIRDLELALSARVAISSGAPTGGADGQEYVDSSTNRRWTRVAGVWRYVTLT